MNGAMGVTGFFLVSNKKSFQKIADNYCRRICWAPKIGRPDIFDDI